MKFCQFDILCIAAKCFCFTSSTRPDAMWFTHTHTHPLVQVYVPVRLRSAMILEYSQKPRKMLVCSDMATASTSIWFVVGNSISESGAWANNFPINCAFAARNQLRRKLNFTSFFWFGSATKRPNQIRYVHVHVLIAERRQKIKRNNGKWEKWRGRTCNEWTNQQLSSAGLDILRKRFSYVAWFVVVFVSDAVVRYGNINGTCLSSSRWLSISFDLSHDWFSIGFDEWMKSSFFSFFGLNSIESLLSIFSKMNLIRGNSIFSIFAFAIKRTKFLVHKS